jgi:hypothetical protein
MAIIEHDHTYLMDLAAVLKALREARDGAAQVVERLTERVGLVGTSTPRPRKR